MLIAALAVLDEERHIESASNRLSSAASSTEAKAGAVAGMRRSMIGGW
jgi:hypothetical protein